MSRIALKLACLICVIHGRRTQSSRGQWQQRSFTEDQVGHLRQRSIVDDPASQPAHEFAAILRFLARRSQLKSTVQDGGPTAAYNPSQRQHGTMERRFVRSHPSRSIIRNIGNLRGGEANNTGDQVETFQVIPVAGNGDCMFQSVAQGLSFAAGEGVLSGPLEHMRAQELRAQAMEELKRRRDEIEWAIEGNFNRYVKRMSRRGKWGGEPELLMLSHSLQCPILVYTYNPDLRCIQTYGEDLQGSPLRLLFHGQGHYEALVAVSKHETQTEP